MSDDEWTSPGWRPPQPPPAQPEQGPPAPQGPPSPQAPPPSGYPPPQGPPHGPHQGGYPPPQHPPYPPYQGPPPGPARPGQVPGTQPAMAPGSPPGAPPDTYYAPGWQAPVGPPPPPRRGPRIALWSIAAVAAVALVVGSIAAFRYWNGTRPLGEVTSAQTVAAGRLSTGHCIATLPADGPVDSVRVVPCDQQHAAEVVGVLPLEDGGWPGEAEVLDRVETWCELDNAQQALGLSPVVWTPTEGSWAQGDRDGLCLAWAPDGGLTGSFTAGDEVATSG